MQTHLDFTGQGLAEKLYQVVIVVCTIIGFIAGYSTEDFKLTFKIWAVGFVLAMVISVPPWPWYRRQPVAWLDKAEPAPPSGRSSRASSSSSSTSHQGKKNR